RPGWRHHHPDQAADSGHARRPDRVVRPGRAEEVPVRGGDGGPAAGGGGRRTAGRSHRPGSRCDRGDALMAYKAALRVWRGDHGQGELADYTVEVNEGEVGLD